MSKSSEGCVFIACDRQDVQEGAQIAALLEQRGLAVWAGPRDAGTADPAQYAAVTRDAAGRCSAFVLLLSGRQVDLDALRNLSAAADAAGRPIYPVRVSEQAFVPDFPALQRARTWIDAAGAQRESELSRLAADLQQLARPAAAPAATMWASHAAPAPAGPALLPGRRPGTARSSGQPRWMSMLWLVVAIVLLISGLARIFKALG